MDINSEEELLGLKNEGKISESEYAELLGAMRRPSPPPPEPSESDDEYASKRKSGKTAFYLLLAGIVVPTIVFFISFAATGGGEGDVIFSACLALCVLIELPALICGVVSWPDYYGKITLTGIAAMVVLALFRLLS